MKQIRKRILNAMTRESDINLAYTIIKTEKSKMFKRKRASIKKLVSIIDLEESATECLALNKSGMIIALTLCDEVISEAVMELLESFVRSMEIAKGALLKGIEQNSER